MFVSATVLLYSANPRIRNRPTLGLSRKLTLKTSWYVVHGPQVLHNTNEPQCHEHLEVPLGPLINFVIGHNGSGKSAILTALTLALGGKATSTNRGSSLKAFIREGQSYVSFKLLECNFRN